MRRAVLSLAIAAVLALPADAFQQRETTVFRDHQAVKAEGRDTLSWELLAELDLGFTSKGPGQTEVQIRFPDAVKALDGKEVRLAGYMQPLDGGEKHSRFLLSAFPPTCPFCLPGGPAEIVEVEMKQPVKFSYETLTLKGRLTLLQDDPSGLLYRLSEAQAVSN
jgi:hypothetical protein